MDESREVDHLIKDIGAHLHRTCEWRWFMHQCTFVPSNVCGYCYSLLYVGPKKHKHEQTNDLLYPFFYVLRLVYTLVNILSCHALMLALYSLPIGMFIYCGLYLIVNGYYSIQKEKMDGLVVSSQ